MNTKINDSIAHRQVSSSLKTEFRLKIFSEYSSSKTFKCISLMPHLFQQAPIS